MIKKDTGLQAKGFHVPCKQVGDNVDIKKSAGVVKFRKEGSVVEDLGAHGPSLQSGSYLLLCDLMH